MKWLCGGLAIAALAFTTVASADEPPPLPPPDPPPPPPTVTVQPGPLPPPALPQRHSRHRRAEAPAQDESSYVEVTLDSDAPGTFLQTLTEQEGFMELPGRYRTHVVYGRALEWRPVCQAPCTMRVPSDLEYRVAGPKVTPSDDFSVGPPGGKMELHTNTGARGPHVAGGIMLLTGVVPTLIGVIFVAAGPPVRTAGWVSGGIGVGLLAIGAVLLATTGTDVTDGKSGRHIGLGPEGLKF